MPVEAIPRTTHWDLAEAHPETPLTRAGHVDADQFWERITYFLDRTVPVANEYKVRMACHPQDPGVPPEGYQGVDRVLGTVDGLKRFISIRESPYHGLNFCQGTVSEMLQDPGKEISDVIRYFGSRKKIFNVHFRNIRGHRNSFMEVFPDEGTVDFVKAIQVYKEVGYSRSADAGPRGSISQRSWRREIFHLLFWLHPGFDSGCERDAASWRIRRLQLAAGISAFRIGERTPGLYPR